MSTFAARYEALKRQVGGNREKLDFEFTFGATREEQLKITPPGRAIIRILSQLDFAIHLTQEHNGRFDPEVNACLNMLENAMAEDGDLTKSVCHEA